MLHSSLWIANDTHVGLIILCEWKVTWWACDLSRLYPVTLIKNGEKRLTRYRVTGGESDSVNNVDIVCHDGFCHCQKEKPDDARGNNNVSQKQQHWGDGSSNQSWLWIIASSKQGAALICSLTVSAEDAQTWQRVTRSLVEAHLVY